jgi:hypothetical protein
VTIHAFGRRERLLEVTIYVTLHAIDGLMLSDQRKLGLRVIEAATQTGVRNTLPPARVVARLATLRGEAAFMRIRVAVRALSKCEAGESRLPL